MKKILTLSLLSLAACTNQVGPISINQVVALGPAGSGDPMDPFCSITDKDEPITLSARIDVAAGDPQLVMGFGLKGKGYNTPGTMLRTGEVLEPAMQNAPVITSAVINYRLSRRLGAAPRTFTQPLTVAFSESGELKARILLQLISPELGQQLFDGLTPSTTLDDFVDIQADIEFRGEMDSSKTPFSSGVVTFPIRAVRSAPTTTCTAPQRFMRFPPRDPLTLLPDTAGVVDLCTYVGTTFNLPNFAPAPAICCTPGVDVGC